MTAVTMNDEPEIRYPILDAEVLRGYLSTRTAHQVLARDYLDSNGRLYEPESPLALLPMPAVLDGDNGVDVLGPGQRAYSSLECAPINPESRITVVLIDSAELADPDQAALVRFSIGEVGEAILHPDPANIEAVVTRLDSDPGLVRTLTQRWIGEVKSELTDAQIVQLLSDLTDSKTVRALRH